LPKCFLNGDDIIDEMESPPVLRYILAGQLGRDYIITPNGNPRIDVLGGNIVYAAVGTAIWEPGVGLIARVGEDFPQEWVAQISQHGFDCHGIRILPESIDLRTFTAFSDEETRHTDAPVAHFARLNLPFPKSLLGYNPQPLQPDSRSQPSLRTIRMTEIPGPYLDATAAHLCPVDFLSHTLLPSVLRQGQVATITVDPAASYMNPIFWDDVQVMVKGVTGLLTSEEKLRSLFEGRTSDLWEMAEAIGSWGCEIIVIKRRGRGQYVYNHGNRSRWMIPAYPARVIDPTGAGDAFCGGFLAGFRSTYEPVDAALHGNISASLVIEGSGPFYALDALPGLAQARLEGLRGMARKA
jgi:sugar/nucleoside kinase (ribokinase family)